ncbi:MAG: hypothetical protein IJ008_01235 [Clostridia bacterium]|nr:hypothetical protein [Clostridia bacterium]
MKFFKLKLSLCLLLMIFVAGFCLTGCGKEEEEETNVSSIVVENYKDQFYYGEPFFLSGIMTVNYKDGSKKTLDLLKDAGVNYLIDESGLGKKDVTIFYDNYEHTISVNYVDYEKIYSVINLTDECYKGDTVSLANAKALVYNASEGVGGDTLANCRQVSLTDEDITISNIDTSSIGEKNIKITYKDIDVSSYYHDLEVKTNVADFTIDLEDSYWYSILGEVIGDATINVEYIDDTNEEFTCGDLFQDENFLFVIVESNYLVGKSTFKLSLDGVEKDFEITVKDYVIIDSISNLKTEFVVGDEFSFGEGVVVTAKYASNNNDVTVELNLDDFEVFGFDSTQTNENLEITIVSKTCPLTTYTYTIKVVSTLTI